MIRLKAECMSCLTKKYMDKYPANATEEQRVEFSRRVLKLISEAPLSLSAPVLVRSINDIRREMFDYEDEFVEEKAHFNELMLEWEEEIAGWIEASKEPLQLALQLAMTGNYIDFGAVKSVEEDYLSNALRNADKRKVDEKTFAALQEDLAKAKHLVYLTDNCGEIVLDKLFIREIMKQYPQLKITTIVRGGAVLNDAQLEDAKQIGLTELVAVLDNGNNIAGTWLEEVALPAKQRIEEADVILAKGQANFETLRGCGLNIYYIFLCKCEMFARQFEVEKFTGMLVNEKKLKSV
ncbi:MAG: DUF89 family protein [Lachnospiraceae bacterium]|nr:DUF89 family protein [Lachnospiraceae bacterium]